MNKQPITSIAPTQLGSSQISGDILSRPTNLVKLGIKGPKLESWAQLNGIELPAKLYDARRIGSRGLFVRVGGEEIIIECQEDDALRAKLEEIMRNPIADVYRIEQQSTTFELIGKDSNRILAQSCGVDFSREPAGRIIYTRLAAASCGIIPIEENSRRVYRIWIDCSLAPYLWETLIEIIQDNVSANLNG
jgi:heterotetrameric sarcosine oxidase gamma subunit